MRKRWRDILAKPGELKAQYGKVRHNEPDLLYAHGGSGACRPDARVLASAFEDANVFDDMKGYRCEHAATLALAMCAAALRARTPSPRLKPAAS